MPRKHPEHDARLLIRLPKAMLSALKWTAEYERLPLSDWVRNTLNANCLSIACHFDEEVLGSRTPSGQYIRQQATRKLTGAGHWLGGREKKPTVRSYTGLDGVKHVGGLPDEPSEQVRQDILMDRAEARRELRTWLNRWGREGKTLRLEGDQLRLARRLLATFDNDPE